MRSKLELAIQLIESNSIDGCRTLDLRVSGDMMPCTSIPVDAADPSLAVSALAELLKAHLAGPVRRAVGVPR